MNIDLIVDLEAIRTNIPKPALLRVCEAIVAKEVTWNDGHTENDIGYGSFVFESATYDYEQRHTPQKVLGVFLRDGYEPIAPSNKLKTPGAGSF